MVTLSSGTRARTALVSYINSLDGVSILYLVNTIVYSLAKTYLSLLVYADHALITICSIHRDTPNLAASLRSAITWFLCSSAKCCKSL